MSDYKAANRAIAERFLRGRYWLPEAASMYDPEFSIELPNAPPGMLQSCDPYDVKLYYSWLADTVKSWQVENIELYGGPDPDLFWAVSDVKGGVHWGGVDGVLDTKRFSKLMFDNGRLIKYAEWTNPLRWLAAAGKELPIFRMDLFDPRIDAYIEAHKNDVKPAAPAEDELDRSAAAIAARTRVNLEYHCAEDYWAASAKKVCAPETEFYVWFLPPEMRENYTPAEMERVDAWSVLSCPDISFSPRGKYYATDVPGVYFCEYACTGTVDWIGNNCPGARYRQKYMYIMRLDEYGRIKVSEEVLNPINKFNSINVPLPSFPYYF